MNGTAQFSPPLETVLAKIKKREESLWGKMQGWNHRWLAHLEDSPFFQNYATLLKKPRGATSLRSEPTIDLDSLFFLSLLFHFLVFFLLTRMTFTPVVIENPKPILVRILDLGKPAQEGKERARKRPKKIARPRSKPSPSPATAKPKPTSPSPKPLPLLPGPKVLAQAPREQVAGLTGEPVESLIQLPTRQSASGQPSLATIIDPLPAVIADERALLPEELRRGESIPQTGAAGSAGLTALSSPDFAPYLEKIKRRIQSVWKYPEGISGIHRVNLVFVLDRGGKLVRVEVLDSSDSKLDSSALQAMKRASPFPAIPESLKELAGWPLRMRFSIDFGVKVAR
ncbi:MAG: TonB family protein [Deltaproteobacteria bacterium]|nr:TonB family protein [Deltaproteobacteria bacterium]